MKVYVANAPGDDYDPRPPSGYDSWIDYWNQLSYPGEERHAGKCRKCGEKKDPDDIEGGHVEYYEKRDETWYRDKERGIFIVPLCTECNDPNNMDVFSVEDSDLIEII